MNGKTQTYGIIAHPVEHSFSPFLHNRLGDLLNMNIAYIPMHVLPENVNEIVSSLKTLDFQGANVSTPYKTEVINQVDVVDEFAQTIGAVNTIKVVDGQTVGYNTDAPGLLKSLEESGISIKGKHVLMIGAGGAAKAVALLCAKEGASALTIANRTLSKAESIKEDIQKRFEIPCVAIAYQSILPDNPYEIAIQTTSAGMDPNIHKTPIQDISLLKNLEFAVDIVYNPKETKFMKDLKSVGVDSINGMGMLFYQGIIAYEIWQDITIDEVLLRQLYKEFLAYMD